jgi:pantetheine-phosphate adenylyltransferase
VAKAIYPGTFDPITNGHLDILSRAAHLFEEVHVVVAVNVRKNTLFSLDERQDLIRGCTSGLKNVHVSSFEGLTVDCLRRFGAEVVIRGLRAVSDFEYEFQMALMNKKLDASCETVYLMPSEQYTYLNSSVIREIAALGGTVSEFVPPMVDEKLREKLGAPRGVVRDGGSVKDGRSVPKVSVRSVPAKAGRVGPKAGSGSKNPKAPGRKR